MNIELNANSCRLCLTKSKKLRSIYKPIDDGEEPPNEMLQKVAGIEVEVMEKFTMLPKNICKNCELSLSMAYEFREKVLQSQQAIVAFMQELQIPYPEEEKASAAPTIHGKYIKQEEDDVLQVQQLIESSDLEENLLLLDSNSNSQLHLDASHITENDYGHDTYIVNEFTEGIYVNDEVEYHNTEQQQYQQCEDDYQQQFLSEKEKEERTNWNLAVRVNSQNLLQNEKNKLLKPGSYYKCDICGNVYDKKKDMLEHQQKHLFACALCEAHFRTRELLRKHMNSHKAEKCLKCQFCYRTFEFESARKNHEAIHIGIKPHVCNVCNKAFGYAHTLKKHQLIHDKVKEYRCDYCNKDFRLRHHMKQHKMTNMHKKAVMAVSTVYYVDEFKE